MLQLVSEQYGFSAEGMEYGLLSPERIAQLEQQDLEQYQRSVLKNPSYQDDEATDYQDELQNKLLVLKDMMDRFCNDLKGLTSPSENGSEPPMMLPHPVSTIYDDVACAEPQTNEDSVVVELPDSMEMQVFDDKNGTGSLNSEEMLHSKETMVSASAINSQFSVNPGLQKQLTIMDSGFKVLSIYCAHMAPKWNSILEMRPKQRNYMSVEDYYNQFFTWRKKLEEVNYIGDEDSYIDDFLYGLKRELAVRVCVYEWKLRSLYGAFRRAEIEETMMKHDAAKVLEEMPQPNSIVNSIGGSLIYDDSKPTHLMLPIFGMLDDQHNACKVSDEMPEPFLEKYLLGIDVEKVAHNLIVEKYVLSPVALDGNFKDNCPSLSKLGFNPQVFDPGTLAFFKQKEYVSRLNENERQLHRKDSELFWTCSHVSGEFNAYTHLVIKFCCCLFEGASSNNIKFDWVLSMWNGWEVLLWSCSALLWLCNRPFVDFHGALVQICSNFDQAAPRLSTGHDIGAENSNIYCRAANIFNLGVYFRAKLCFIFFCHLCMFMSASHVIIPLQADGIAHRDIFSKTLLEEANSKSLRKLLCYCTLPLGRLTNDLDFMSCFESRIILLSLLIANFDPGHVAVSIHILEDKDNFKRVGDGILVMVMIRSIIDGKYGMVWSFWCTAEYEVAEYIALEVKGGAHHILNEDMFALQGNVSSFGLIHPFYFGNYHVLDVVKISMLVLDPGGSSWFHIVWCSSKSNDDQQDLVFGFGEQNAGSFCTSFRWKVCLNVATILGLVSSLVTQLSQFNILLSAACIRFNPYKLLRRRFTATILLSVEVLSKLLGDRVLIHLAALAGGNYNIHIFVVGIMVKSWSNAWNYASLLDSGMNTFGNVVAIIYHSFEIHSTAADKSMVLVRFEREFQDCPSFGLENIIWNPGIVDLVCSYVTLLRSRYTVLYDHSVPNEHTKNNVAVILPSQAALLRKMLFHRSYLTIENPVSSQFMKSGQPHYDNIVHLQDMGWRPAVFMLLLRESEPKSGTMVDSMKDLGLNERSASL